SLSGSAKLGAERRQMWRQVRKTRFGFPNQPTQGRACSLQPLLLTNRTCHRPAVLYPGAPKLLSPATTAAQASRGLSGTLIRSDWVGSAGRQRAQTVVIGRTK